MRARILGEKSRWELLSLEHKEQWTDFVQGAAVLVLARDIFSPATIDWNLPV